MLFLNKSDYYCETKKNIFVCFFPQKEVPYNHKLGSRTFHIKNGFQEKIIIAHKTVHSVFMKK